MHSLPIPFQLILHPIRYMRYWARIYRHWEFWLLSAILIGASYTLTAAGLMPKYLIAHPTTLKAIVTAIILLPMPYVLAKDDLNLTSSENRSERFSRALPPIASALLVISAICFLLPIFISQKTGGPLSGLTIIAHHPLTAGVPLLYIVTAELLARNFRDWRWVGVFWIAAAYIGTFAVAGLYTDFDHDPAKAFEIPTDITQLAPLLAGLICFIGRPTLKDRRPGRGGRVSKRTSK